MTSASTIPLEHPASIAGDGLATVLMERRSVREYRDGELALEEVGRLLWAGQGISHSSGKRTAPSAHALYPLSLFLLGSRVTGLEPGLYDYTPRTHALAPRGHGDLRGELYEACLEDQVWVRDCSAMVIVAGDKDRAREAFADQPPRGQRGERYLYLEAGAVGQNIALQGTELGIGMVVVGGFDDERVRRVLGIDTSPLILMPLGRLPE